MSAIPAPDAQFTDVRPDDRGANSAFVIVFHRGETELCQAESSRMRQWIQSWRQAGSGHELFAGCGRDSPTSARLARMQSLRNQLRSLGIPAGRIHFSTDWTDPTWRATDQDLPADVIWLRVANAKQVAPGVWPIGSLVVTTEPQ